MKSIETATVTANQRICRDHYRLTLQIERLETAFPGQFVHISPVRTVPTGYRCFDWSDEVRSEAWSPFALNPMLRRAFSIAGLSKVEGKTRIDVIHRVVGAATGWMQTLSEGDEVSVLGPLGNRFPIEAGKSQAWLIAGGVGLPPMLWMAEALRKAGHSVVAFCGAQRAELLPLTIDPHRNPSSDARVAIESAAEFALSGVPVVISTDDGSLGFHGHVGQALSAYHSANPPNPDDLTVYTCGPERMMHFVGQFCQQKGIACHVCMERNMACGLGTCQSCVVPMVNDADAQGWTYRLCCTDGPVFDAAKIVWKSPAKQATVRT